MRHTFKLFFLFLFFVATISAQNLTREQKLKKIEELNSQIKLLEQSVVSPDAKDLEKARKEDLHVFRIMPREKYDHVLTIRGGAAYYSFYFKIHDWGHGNDIGLEQNYFTNGSTDILMADLGEVSLGEISKETQSVNSLINYQVGENYYFRRDFEALRGKGLTLDETVFKSRLPAVVGHTYIIRSINPRYYDILVAFRVERMDADDSLVIFWKPIEQFDTPSREDRQKTRLTDAEIIKKTQNWARADIFPDLRIDVSDGVVTLRGTVPNDKLAYAVQLANDSGATKIINLLAAK